MAHFRNARSAWAAQQYSHLFSGQAEASGPRSPAAILLDCGGTIRYCHADTARVFHTYPSSLLGRHVRELVPELPLDRRTPGYNLAFAAFWAREARSIEGCGVDDQGRSFPVKVALETLELDKGPHILLHLRPSVELASSPGLCGTSGEHVELRAGADPGAAPAA